MHFFAIIIQESELTKSWYETFLILYRSALHISTSQVTSIFPPVIWEVPKLLPKFISPFSMARFIPNFSKCPILSPIFLIRGLTSSFRDSRPIAPSSQAGLSWMLLWLYTFFTRFYRAASPSGKSQAPCNEVRHWKKKRG